jgi:hypothetical protein
MRLQTVGPPDRGSLSVVYSCPQCGYEIAMLTNAYETQVVQSLGVRIGPSGGDSSSTAGAAGPSAGTGASGTSCPFSGMIPGTKGTTESIAGRTGQPIPIQWTPAAEARLANIPAFVRPMARAGIEKFARENGALEVDEEILDAARDFFGM